MRQRKIVPGVDPKLLIKDAAQAAARRQRGALFLRGAASLGALTFLTGCDIIDGDTAEKRAAQDVASSTTGRRRRCSIRTKLAPTYPESAITRPFPFNGYYDEDEAPEVDGDSYKLEVAGLVDNKKPWTLDELHALPRGVADHAPRLRRRLERHRLVAGRAAVGFPQAHRRRHRAPNMSGSNAPRATPTRSTCRPRCIRRRR